MFFWDVAILLFSTFSSLYLVVGMSVMTSGRYLFYRSGVFVFRETVLTRSASNPEFLICFSERRLGSEDFLS